MDINTFIEKSKLKHGDKYIYDKVIFEKSNKKVIIVCPLHGDFTQKPISHLQYGCEKCGILSARSKNTQSKDSFIKRSIEIHKNKYDYSEVIYITNKTNVKIKCPIHGIFEQTPFTHLKGSGCRICGIERSKQKNKKDLNKFKEEANLKHQFKYDYSLVNYTNTMSKVEIICPKHGSFYQQCLKHLHGRGCPTCSESSLEKIISDLLKSENISFFREYGKQNDLFFLKGQKVDFYLPDFNIAIECQGDQHFIPVDFGNRGHNFALECFQKNVIRDTKKYIECKKNGITILYFCEKKYMRDDYIGDLYCELDKIKKRILLNE